MLGHLLLYHTGYYSLVMNLSMNHHLCQSLYYSLSVSNRHKVCHWLLYMSVFRLQNSHLNLLFDCLLRLYLYSILEIYILSLLALLLQKLKLYLHYLNTILYCILNRLCLSLHFHFACLNLLYICLVSSRHKGYHPLQYMFYFLLFYLLNLLSLFHHHLYLYSILGMYILSLKICLLKILMLLHCYLNTSLCYILSISCLSLHFHFACLNLLYMFVVSKLHIK